MPKNRKKFRPSSGQWNPNQPQDELLDPYDYGERVPSPPTSDYPMSEYDETERPYTPNSIMTTYDYEYAQSELLRIQGIEGSEMVQKLVEEQTDAMKLQLEEAKHELEETNRQALDYKKMYDQLMVDTQVLTCCVINLIIVLFVL